MCNGEVNSIHKSYKISIKSIFWSRYLQKIRNKYPNVLYDTPWNGLL